MYNIILLIDKIILYLQERTVTFCKQEELCFVNIKFFVSVNKRRCIILFFLLRNIILYLQDRRVTFLQTQSSLSLLIRDDV